MKAEKRIETEVMKAYRFSWVNSRAVFPTDFVLDETERKSNKPDRMEIKTVCSFAGNADAHCVPYLYWGRIHRKVDDTDLPSPNVAILRVLSRSRVHLTVVRSMHGALMHEFRNAFCYNLIEQCQTEKSVVVYSPDAQ